MSLSASVAAHPAVAAYAKRHGVDASAFRSDGRLSLRFDGRLRVHIRQAPGGRLALLGRLMGLEGRTAQEIDHTLQRLATVAAGLLREQSAGLCVDEGQEALVLQSVLPAETTAEQLQAELADFVNMLVFWEKVCSADAPGPRV